MDLYQFVKILKLTLPFNIILCSFMLLSIFTLGNFTSILGQPHYVDSASNYSSLEPTIVGATDADMARGNTCSSRDGNPTSIAVETDKSIYVPLDGVGIVTSVYDNNGCLIPAKVIVQIAKVDDEIHRIVYRQSFTSGTDDTGSFTNYNYFTSNEPGTYNITATTIIDGKGETSWKILYIQEFYFSRFAFMWFVGFVFFVSLIVLILKSTANRELNEVLRFTFISGIIFSILLSFIFLNEKVSEVSPIGIVTKDVIPEGSESISTSIAGVQDNILGDGQWVLNIGGQAEGYLFGIQIPIGILIFGIAGGYLRYLYKTSKLYKDYKEYFASEKDDVRFIDFGCSIIL